MQFLFKSHPWHGIPALAEPPDVYNVYVELVPTDTVKYEIDKRTGHLRVDRPQKYSSLCPTLYGFVPQTYCGDQVGELCRLRTGRADVVGDGDPLDICVLTENLILHADILVPALPIGGLRMLDGDQADDKVIAVMRGDAAYGGWRDVAAVPNGVIERLQHYFLTYKDLPDRTPHRVEVVEVYGREEALEVIRRAGADYAASYGGAEERLARFIDVPSGPDR